MGFQMLTWPMMYTAFAQFIGGPFVYGWNINCVGLPGPFIKKFINQSMWDHYGTGDRGNEKIWQDSLMSVAVLLLSLGGAFGGFGSASLMDYFGRRKAVLLTHFFSLVAAALYGICKITNCFELLFVARFLVGLASGACFSIVPVYATEITPQSLRGAVGTGSQLSITLGILVSTVFVLQDTLGTEELWPYGICIMAVFSIISAVMLIMPMAAESPKWLLVVKKDEKAAEAELRKLYKRSDVTEQMNEIKREANLLVSAGAKPPPEEKWGFCKLFSSKELRWPLTIVILLNISQQLSGINVVFFYSNSLYEGAGLKDKETSYASLVVNAINVVTTIAAVPLIERFGRRQLLLYPMVLMCLAMIGQVVLLAIPYEMGLRGIWLEEGTQVAMSWAAIVCVGLFVIGFALGLGPIPNFSASEVFRPGPRATAAAIGTVTNLVGTLIVSVLFENVLQKYLLCYSFLPFLVISILSLIFFWIKLPETKDRSIADIYKDLGVKETGEPEIQMEGVKVAPPVAYPPPQYNMPPMQQQQQYRPAPVPQQQPYPYPYPQPAAQPFPQYANPPAVSSSPPDEDF